VTVQSQEFLDRAAEELGRGFDCGATRRNLTVGRGEIPTQPGARLLNGDVELEVVRAAAPCRLLERGYRPRRRGVIGRVSPIDMSANGNQVTPTRRGGPTDTQWGTDETPDQGLVQE
jgi:hypothetical protein